MTLKNYLALSSRRSDNSPRDKQQRTMMSFLGALLGIITLALPISAQTNTTNSNGKTPSGLAPGQAAGAYPLSGFENINLFNGNLSFRVPLMIVGGRGSVAGEITLGLNSKSWRVNHFHREMPDGNEIDNYSPTQTCTGGGTGYLPASISGKRTGIFTSTSLSCGTRYSRTLSRLNFQMPDGTELELRDQLTGGEPKSVAGFACDSGFNRGTVFVSADGSAATFISDTPIVDNGTLTGGCGGGFSVSGVMLLRDGTRYRFDSGKLTWIRDRNGNKISYTYDASGRLSVITDPLNRQITFNYDVSEGAPYGVSDHIIFKGAGGAQRIIRISRTEMANALRPNSGFSIQTHQQLFPELNNSSPTTTYNPTVISKVWLPNSDGTGQHHQFYQFFYNSYGELARVELPAGGAFEYDMTPGSGVIFACQFCDGPEINRRLRERRVYADGSSGSTYESKTTYEVTSDSTAFDPYPWSSTVTTETVNQSGGVVGRSRHFFEGSAFVSLFKSYGADVYSVWNDGREKKTEILDTSGPLASATILRRTETSLEQRTTVSWWSAWCATHGTNLQAPPLMDPRVTEIKTTIEPNGANLVSKQVFDYDDFVPFNNQNNVKEYGFNTGAPGALIRETQITYLTSPTYTDTNVHLRSLVTQVSVFEGATERSRSSMQYDNYTAGGNYAALTDRPNISGFDSAFGTQYTTRGNPTSSTRYLLVNGIETGSISTFSQYDIAGTSVKSIDGRGFATTSDFSDRFGAPDADARTNSGSTELNAAGKFSYAFPTLVTNALGHTIYTQFDYYLGKPVDTEDVNGVVSSSFYNDSLDRPTQIIKGSNLAGHPKTQVSYNYDDVNRIITTTSDHNTFNDPSPLKSQTVNDKMGRTIETRQYESASGYITTKNEYDALGRAHRVSNPFRSGESVLWTTRVFDALWRVTSVTTPDGAIVSTSYSGNSVTTTDQDGKQRKSISDALGRIVSLNEAPNNPSYNYLTSYSYDLLDNLTTVTQGVQTRSFVYDSLKRLKSSTNPESGTTTYQYDGNDNLTEKIDARGVVSTYTYDALNRTNTISYTNDPAGTPTMSRYYDGFRGGVNNNIPYSKGKLWQTETSGAKGSRTTINSFDAQGNPQGLSQQFYNGTWGPAYTVTRTYNLAGLVTSQTYPSQRVINYTYDVAGRIYSFDGNLGGLSRTYSNGTQYSPLGGMTQEQFGTDTVLYNKIFYNSRGQQAEIRVGTFHATDNSWWNRGAIINHFSHSCWGACGGSNSSTPMTDNNGNLKKQEVYIPANDQISSYTQWWQGYDYDPLNRLERVHEYAGGSADSQQEYVYDRYGNRTLHQTNTFGTGINKKNFTVNTNNNRLGVPGGQGGTMTYDNAGNLYVDTYSGFAVNRVFDGENRMTSETQAGSVVAGSYTYDSDGQRVRRNLAGVETWQVYGFDGELVAEYPANGPSNSPQKEYGYRNGQLLITTENPSTATPSTLTANPPSSGSSITLNWLQASGATNYRVERKPAGGTFTLAGTTSSTTLVDSGPTSGNAYLYRVCAADGAGNCTSAFSNLALGTAITFTDPTIISIVEDPSGATVTSLKAAHVNELRAAVTAVRTLAGLPAPTWTYPNIIAGHLIHVEDVRELRTKLGEALTALAIQTTAYTDPTLQGFVEAPLSATLIKAVHIRELRQRVTSGIGASGGGGTTQLNWLVTDHLGTPRMVIDKTGSLAGVRRHDYLPFGEELLSNQGLRTTAMGYGSNDGVRQKFTAQERDSETGLDYFQARYYASTQGRFTSVDPLLESGARETPQSWNRYAYVLNNPLMYTDPTGEIWVRSNKGDIVWFSQERWDNEISKLTDANGNAVYTALSPSEMEFNTTHGRVRLNPNGPDPNAAKYSDAYLGYSIIGENQTEYSVALAAGVAIGAKGRHPLLMLGGATLVTLWVLSGPVNQSLPLVDPNIYARKRDLDLVDHVADQYGVDRYDLGRAIEEAKESLGRYKGRRAPDLTKKEIEELAKQLPKKKE